MEEIAIHASLSCVTTSDARGAPVQRTSVTAAGPAPQVPSVLFTRYPDRIHAWRQIGVAQHARRVGTAFTVPAATVRAFRLPGDVIIPDDVRMIRPCRWLMVLMA